MKKSIYSGLTALLLLAAGPSYGQRACGNALLHEQLQREQPEAYRELRARHLERAHEAQENADAASKSTATFSPIPVVFHILVSQTQYITLGRDTGIRHRVNSQLAALNRDFNRRNADASRIPAAFKGRYANPDIQFGLTTQTSAHTSTIGAGIELKILTTAPNYDVNNGCRAAKDPAQGGLAAWDPSKYINVWIVKMPLDLLGVSIATAEKGYTMGGRLIDESDYGVVMSMGAFGAREFPSQTFSPPVADMGRTLTHELGHFFNLLHTWGDDDNGTAAGYCPGQMLAGQQVGFDDGITDTPPQARRTYCDVGGAPLCPTYPLLDACSPAAPGIMFMNFMDYVDDSAMVMFSSGQVAVMRAEIAEGSGPFFSLTQQPGAIKLSTATVSPEAFQIYPNPAGSTVHVSLSGTEQLRSIQLMNFTGQVIAEINADGRRVYELPTATFARGLYFVQCRFAEGTVSRKIVLQ